MANELDREALNRMVQALQPPMPTPDPRKGSGVWPVTGIPLPTPDPRGSTFNDRLPVQLKEYMYDLQHHPFRTDTVPPDKLLTQNGYPPDAAKDTIKSELPIMDQGFNSGIGMPTSYGAGKYKIYTPNMPAPQNPDVITNWLKNNP